jgi:putative transposase
MGLREPVGMHTDSASAGYRHLRKGRISIPGQIYLLTTVCADRRSLFANPGRASATVLVLREQRLWRDSTAMCWVLMPDHLHLMLALGESESLAHAMNRIKSVTSRAARAVGRDVGVVWMPGFHDRALRRDDDVLAAMRYVLANPVRAGLLLSLEAYPYRQCIWGCDVLNMSP